MRQDEGIHLFTDINDNLLLLDGGSGFRFRIPVYERGSDNSPAFTWYQVVTYTALNADGTFDTSSGANDAKLVYNRNAVITMSSVQNQRQYAITGGSGRFACATGIFTIVEEKGNRLYLESDMCYSC